MANTTRHRRANAASLVPGLGREPLLLTKLWLFFSAWCCGVGLFLSAVHQLNARGYLVAAAGTVMGAATCLGRRGWGVMIGEARVQTHRLRRRLRRPLPMCFVLLGVLAFLGGAWYQPSNPDMFIYRLPRLLHWLALEQWHWIHTGDGRQNYYGFITEWLSAPLVVCTRSERPFFLLSLLSYVQLPGLVFLLFRGLGVPARTAWSWMWVLMAGWSFALQAGSAANDLLGTVYATAALALALRARRRQSVGDWWWSLLAAALMTNAKQTNLPLLLPWFIAAAAAWRLPASRPWSTAAVGLAAVAVSCVFNTVMNLRHTGLWLGWPEGTPIKPESWWIGVIGDTFTLTVRNLIPPVFPWASAWNRSMEEFLTTPLGAHFRTFEYFGMVPRAVAEETAGFGLFPVLFLAGSCLAAVSMRRKLRLPTPRRDRVQRLVLWGGGVTLLVFLAKLGACQNARTLTPYHPLLAAAVLGGIGHAYLTRRLRWNRLAVVVMLSTAALLVMSRQRPLWPAQTTIGWAAQRWPHSRLVAALAKSYSFTGDLYEVSKRICDALPPEEKTVGLAAYYPYESQLWKPYGSRRVVQIRKDDTPDSVRAMNIHVVIVSDHAVLESGEGTLARWLERWRGRIERTIPARLAPEAPPVNYYVVRLQNG